jgi:hypothetical protein
MLEKFIKLSLRVSLLSRRALHLSKLRTAGKKEEAGLNENVCFEELGNTR